MLRLSYNKVKTQTTNEVNMYPDMCDEWHLEDVECIKNPQEDYFSTALNIVYGSGWTKKDRLEYNRIFEDLS